jgi:hypothetical protein
MVSGGILCNNHHAQKVRTNVLVDGVPVRFIFSKRSNLKEVMRSVFQANLKPRRR